MRGVEQESVSVIPMKSRLVPDEACRPRKNNSAMIKECNNGYLYEDGRIDNHCIIIDSEGRLFGKSAP